MPSLCTLCCDGWRTDTSSLTAQCSACSLNLAPPVAHPSCPVNFKTCCHCLQGRLSLFSSYDLQTSIALRVLHVNRPSYVLQEKEPAYEWDAWC